MEANDRWLKMYRLIEGQLTETEISDFFQELQADDSQQADWELFQIEQYLDKNLKGNWKVDFEKRVKMEPAFHQLVEWHKEQRRTLKIMHTDNIKNELKSIFPKQEVEITHQRIRFLPWKTIAAAIAVLIISALLWLKFDTPKNDQLFAQYYEPYQMILTARGEVSEKSDLKEGIDAYISKDFKRALSVFEKEIQKNPNRSVYALYAGIAALENNENDLAISFFKSLRNDVQYSVQAKWYLGLSYLKSGEQSKAKEFFNQVKAESQNDFKKKAMDILDRM